MSYNKERRSAALKPTEHGRVTRPPKPQKQGRRGRAAIRSRAQLEELGRPQNESLCGRHFAFLDKIPEL